MKDEESLFLSFIGSVIIKDMLSLLGSFVLNYFENEFEIYEF